MTAAEKAKTLDSRQKHAGMTELFIRPLKFVIPREVAE